MVDMENTSRNKELWYTTSVQITWLLDFNGSIFTRLYKVLNCMFDVLVLSMPSSKSRKIFCKNSTFPVEKQGIKYEN